jgi:hypothetical protein
MERVIAEYKLNLFIYFMRSIKGRGFLYWLNDYQLPKKELLFEDASVI